MEKRYQVFVSSTYQDLVEERQHVIQGLLELNCMPCSMEFFPAANEEVWEAIQELIRSCDYYLVVIAGAYGSEAKDGISYTRKEYEYAVSIDKPVMAFLHSKPGSIPRDKSEVDRKRRKKLEEFIALCQLRLCKTWDSPADLKGKVIAGLVHLMKRHPSVGWVRGDQVPDESAAQTIARLYAEIEGLKRQLVRSPGTEAFSQGEDKFMVEYESRGVMPAGEPTRWKPRTQTLSWNDIFAAIAVKLLTAASEEQLVSDLNALIRKRHGPEGELSLKPESFHRIVVQLKALGLITKAGAGNAMWTLTEHGDEQLTKLLAIKKAQPASDTTP